MHFTFRPYDYRLAHNWMIASSLATGGKSLHHAVLVELRDADGVVGYGEASPSTRYDENAQTSVAFLQKIEATHLSFDDVDSSMQYVEAVSPNEFSAKGAINVALLDGAAKKAKRPLHDFLGLGFTDGKHLTSVSIGIDEPERVREKVREFAGFPILKLKVGSEDDAKNLAALRDVAPETTLRIDANEAWQTKEEALRRIEEFARDPHIEFIEQPLPAARSPDDFKWLKARSPMLIVADESYINGSDAACCAECFHGVNVKLVKTGGVSRALEALQAARALGLKTMIGSMVESSILTSAGAHLAALADWLDLDGSLLITNDPFRGVTSERGVMSFKKAPEPYGLQVKPL